MVDWRAVAVSISAALVTVLATALAHAQEVPAVSMPPMDLALSSSLYPASAQRERKQGHVLVAFNISKRGRIDEAAVVQADPEGIFDSAALNVVRSIKFSVPRDWEQKGGPERRFQLSVLFKLSPCPPATCTAPKAHPEADDFVIVGAEMK